MAWHRALLNWWKRTKHNHLSLQWNGRAEQTGAGLSNKTKYRMFGWCTSERKPLSLYGPKPAIITAIPVGQDRTDGHLPRQERKHRDRLWAFSIRELLVTNLSSSDRQSGGSESCNPQPTSGFGGNLRQGSGARSYELACSRMRFFAQQLLLTYMTSCVVHLFCN